MSYGMRLNKDELFLYSDGAEDVDDSPLSTLPTVTITIRADQRNSGWGSADAWLDAVEKLFPFLETMSSPSYLELEVYNMRREWLFTTTLISSMDQQ